LDGPLTVWANDVNNNGVLQTSGGTTETGEHAYLYAGMRRGGKNYYALDVTNRNSPELKWAIKGGQGDFTELAQTWSRPQLARIKSGGVIRTVLLFGGGYDVNQDAENAGVDSEGRALYMVDATTGARVWWAGGPTSGADLVLAAMSYSMPATVLQADINADTLTDIIFAVDIGGQIWRFDLDNSGDDTVITGGLIARLAGPGTGEHRRFYERPDVSLLKRSNGQLVYAIGVGSGYRAHPLSMTTQDRYHMLFVGDVYSPPASYTVLTENDLLDVTNNLTPNLSGALGWYINLEAGEKIMARSKTVDGQTLFTSFKPNQGNANSCAPSQGLGRLYAVNTYDARPLHNLDGVDSLGNLTADDRSLNLVRGGIQPEPTLIFTKDDHPIIVVGTEKVLDIPLYLPLKRTSWEDQ
jgi:type IV pilus assembly protein PilY1